MRSRWLRWRLRRAEDALFRLANDEYPLELVRGRSNLLWARIRRIEARLAGEDRNR